MNKTGNFILGLLTGGAIGAAFGILYAPQKGRKTRDELSFQVAKQYDKVKELAEDIVQGKKDEIVNEAKKEIQKKDKAVRAEVKKLSQEIEKLQNQIK